MWCSGVKILGSAAQVSLMTVDKPQHCCCFSNLYNGYKKTPHLVNGHEKYMRYSRKILKYWQYRKCSMNSALSIISPVPLSFSVNEHIFRCAVVLTKSEDSRVTHIYGVLLS